MKDFPNKTQNVGKTHLDNTINNLALRLPTQKNGGGSVQSKVKNPNK